MEDVKTNVRGWVDKRTDLEKARASSGLVMDLLLEKISKTFTELREDSGSDALGTVRNYFDNFTDLPLANKLLGDMYTELSGLRRDISSLSSVVSVNAVNARVWEIAVELSDIY